MEMRESTKIVFYKKIELCDCADHCGVLVDDDDDDEDDFPGAAGCSQVG